jgi:hypothetical protein
MTIYVANVRAHVQGLVLIVKMATVLEECTTEDLCPVMHFFGGAKGLIAKDIN